jgi:Na+/glutamate symporter
LENELTLGGINMTIEIFFWSVVASIVAAAIIGGPVYKIINKNKTKKSIKQKGNNNTAFMDSSININSNKSKGKK